MQHRKDSKGLHYGMQPLKEAPTDSYISVQTVSIPSESSTWPCDITSPMGMSWRWPIWLFDITTGPTIGPYCLTFCYSKNFTAYFSVHIGIAGAQSDTTTPQIKKFDLNLKVCLQIIIFN